MPLPRSPRHRKCTRRVDRRPAERAGFRPTQAVDRGSWREGGPEIPVSRLSVPCERAVRSWGARERGSGTCPPRAGPANSSGRAGGEPCVPHRLQPWWTAGRRVCGGRARTGLHPSPFALLLLSFADLGAPLVGSGLVPLLRPSRPTDVADRRGDRRGRPDLDARPGENPGGMGARSPGHDDRPRASPPACRPCAATVPMSTTVARAGDNIVLRKGARPRGQGRHHGLTTQRRRSPRTGPRTGGRSSDWPPRSTCGHAGFARHIPR